MARIPATRTRSKRRSPERALHMTVEAFLRRAWPDDLPYTHFPAGELRDARTAAKLKAMGLKPGWPDFQFILPNGQFAALELKASRGALTDGQTALRDKLLAVHCGYATARTLDEVEDVLSRWLALFGRSLRATTVGRAA